MHARPLAFSLSLAPLFAGSLAYAQAPGDLEPPAVQPMVVQPMVVQPMVVQPAVAQPVVARQATPAPDGACAAPCSGCSQAEPVMANRWSIGLSLGQMSLAPEGLPDSKTDFGIGELALRFRATPHLELELAAGGGREQLADNQEGDLEVNTAVLAARYRFRPEAAWNWFVMGGLGGASVTRHDATKQERDDATHPLGMLGIGIERRFHHFALQAEARAIGIGDKHRSNDTMAEPPSAPQPGALGAMATTTTTPGEKQSGGSLTIGLGYYF